MQEKITHHGGDIGWAVNHFGTIEQGWIDLSTGINQNQYPIDIKLDIDINSLPSRALYEDCLKATESYYQGTDITSNMVLMPGSQIIISQLPYLFTNKKICIIWPTYGEHGKAWTLAGHEVLFCKDISDAENDNPDFILVVNPNNPDGKLYDREFLLKRAARQAEKGGYLIVDEAFIDLSPENSLSNCAGTDGLIILRSFGKFFGLAGVRLGTLLAPLSICTELRNRIGPWAVPSPTLAIATQAQTDQKWIKAQIEQLKLDTQRMDDLLSKAGCEIIGGTELYRLVSHKNASALFQHLGQSGIYTRHFEYNAKWLRFGLPASSDETSWKRLEKALASFS